MAVRKMVFSAMIAALYIALVMMNVGYSFSAVQFRVAEALTLLPFLFPEAIPGLLIGCALSNLFSGLGAPDVVFGSLATLLAAYLTSRCRNRYVAALPPVIINAVVVGLLITLFTPDTNATMAAFAANAALVGLGQSVVCFAMGVPLVYALQKLDIREKLRL